MASFNYCIDQAFKGGKINKSVAEQLKQAQDPQAAIQELAVNYSRVKREKLIDAVRVSVAMEKLQSHPNGPIAGLQALLSRDIRMKAGYANIDYLAKTYEKQFLAQFGDALSIFRTRMFGLSSNEEGLTKFVKAVYGETVDDPEIMKAAKSWLGVAENMRVKFNEVGGSISKNENWLFPQNHDMRVITKAGKKEWVAYISNRLDRNKMLDDTGKPLNDAELAESLSYVYETITSGGMNKAQGLSIPRGLGRKLSRKGSEERFLYFKDADSWLSYQNKFGKGDPLTTLTDHIMARSNDIALAETLGTNPRVMYDTLKNQARQLQSKSGEPVKESAVALMDATYKTVSGEINGGNLLTIADGVQFVRNIQVASKLGGAFLASFTDVATSALTAHYNGMSATKVFKRHMKLFASGTEEDRKALARMGLILETWTGRAHSQNRFSDTYGTGASAKTAEFVLRASLLEPWTEAGRKAFGMEFAGLLSDNFGKQIDQLDPALLKGFETYGITKEDWDAFRKTSTVDIQGSKFADLTKDKSMKFHRMILTETDFAVPTPDARVRAIATGGLERGTAWGQISRSAMMIKSFPITMITTHLYRGFTQATRAGRAGYITSLLASTTLMGAFAMQAKDVARGREPRDMDGKFWGAAAVQGGGLGLFGDFIFSDVNRYGQGFAMTVAGPMASFANDTFDLTFGNFFEAISGEETNILGEGIKFVENITPDPWQSQLFISSFYDNWRTMADPDYEKTLNQIRRRRMQEYNQGYWWARGETPMEVLEDL